MSSITSTTNWAIALILILGLGLVVYAWIRSRMANKKSEKERRLAQRRQRLSNERNAQRRLQILQAQCQIISADLETLKKLYESIKTVAEDRVTEASLEKVHKRIQKRVALIDSISNYVSHKPETKDDDFIALEQEILSVEKYAAAQRESAGKTLDIVIPIRRRRQFRRKFSPRTHSQKDHPDIPSVRLRKRQT